MLLGSNMVWAATLIFSIRLEDHTTYENGQKTYQTSACREGE
jgi:hypothetical protein